MLNPFRRLAVGTLGCLLFLLLPPASSLAADPPPVPLLNESSSDSFNSAPVPCFAQQLADLPPLAAAGAPRVWGWGHVRWDPANPEHLAYARVAGGLLVIADRPNWTRDAAEVAAASGARLGLRLHPWQSVTQFWHEGPGADPNYAGPEVEEHLELLLNRLWKARAAAGDVPIVLIVVDCETWVRDAPKALDRRAWNDGILQKHNLVVQVIRRILGDVRIEWYNFAPRWHNLTLQEETAAASLSLYTPSGFAGFKDILTDAIQFQFARGLPSTTVYFSLDAGWTPTDGGRTWFWSYGADPRQSYEFGKLFRNYNFHSVHDLIDYSFHAKNEHWRPHCLAFFQGLLGQSYTMPSCQGGIEEGK